MNWVDIATIAVLVCSGLLSAMRGIVRETLGIGAWVGAGFWAVATFPSVQPRFREWVQNPDLADVAAFGSMFLVALVFLWIIANIVGGAVRGSILGGLDRTLGVVFGFARGAALVVFAYIIGGMVMAPEQWPDSVLQARLLPMAYEGAAWASGLFPQRYQPHVAPPPAARNTRAADLLHANPQDRAIGRP